VHSLPSPPRSARPTAVRPRHSRRRRLRLVPVVTVCGVAAGVALSVPVLQPVTDSFADTAVGLDSSSQWDHWGTSARHQRSSVVQWDVDGAPAATATPSAATPPPSTTTEAPGAQPAPPTAAAPETTTDEQETATASSSSSQNPAPQASTNASTSASTSASTGRSTGGSTGGSSKTSTSASSGASAPPVAAAAPADPSAEGQVLALVNQQRAAAGCGAVSADPDLAALARAFSADMRDRHFFSHTDPDGLSPFDRGDRAGVTVLAENIAYGQPDPAAVMTAWMNSPGHRANILNCSYTKLGVGVADGTGGPWWTQDFA
jgi:uncharacterized protein YkwD